MSNASRYAQSGDSGDGWGRPDVRSRQDDLDELSRRRARRAALWTLTAVLIVATTSACVDDGAISDDGEAGALGVMRLALSATVPGATHMRVRVYNGTVKTFADTPRYALGCVPYADTDGSVKNPFTLDRLPLRTDYAVLVELFADADCKEGVLFAYRGGIAVKAVSTATAGEAPYYLQPARYDQFTGMAVASASASAAVAARSCTADAECHGAHPAAVCRDNRCALDSLFPLNGGARRGLPTAVVLSDGRVAVHGGVSAHGDGDLWASTSQRVEIFEPRLGRFETPAANVLYFENVARTALGGTVAGDAATLLVLGGSARLAIARKGAKLVAGLDAATCTIASSNCPVSASVKRADLNSKISTGTTLPQPRARPIVARIVTASGSRLLIAGGAALPLPKSGDPRLGDAVICQLDGTTADCNDAKAVMVAARANAATLCLDATALGCRRLLIFGGRLSKSAPLAEIYDATKDTFEAVELGQGFVPESVHGGALVAVKGGAALLLGATANALFLDPAATTDPKAVEPLRIEIDESTSPTRLTLAKIDLGAFAGTDAGRRALSTVVGLGDGGLLYVGGLDDKGAIVSDAIRFDADGLPVARVALEVARYGAASATAGTGLFTGCAMIFGGFSEAKAGGADVALAHTEIFCPSAK